MALAPLFALIALVNLVFLTALAAGQMGSAHLPRLSGKQRFSLLAQVIAELLAIAFGVVAVSGHRPNVLQLISIVGALLAIPIAIGLVYVEYALVGRRKDFRRVMRESLWAGRYGTGKWFAWWPQRRDTSDAIR